jgi:hypothetical protein
MLRPKVSRSIYLCVKLLLAFASAVILGSESHGSRDHIIVSQILDSTNLEGQVRVFISSRNMVAQLHPQVLGFPPANILNSLYSYSPETHRTENTVPLLQCNCLATADVFHCCVRNHPHRLNKKQFSVFLRTVA